jgi:beta-lactam-binding protein with PASTA domain
MQFRRPSGATPQLPFLRTMAGRRFVKQAAIVIAAFAVGYLITVFWLFPAPFFSSQHAVPRVIDLGVTEARQKLEAQGMRFRIEDQETDPAVPKNAVVRQDPPPGVVVPPNTVVSLVLSDGPPDVAVPDVAGFPRPLAERVLKAAGFQLGRTDTLPSASDRGIVVQTRPGPGVGRPAGTAIELVVSSGKADLTVPSMVGLTLVEARARLAEIGLSVGAVSTRAVSGRPDGTILEQRPAAGTRTGRGNKVDLIVAGKS